MTACRLTAHRTGQSRGRPFLLPMVTGLLTVLVFSGNDISAQVPARLPENSVAPANYGYAPQLVSPTPPHSQVQQAVATDLRPGQIQQIRGEIRQVQNSPDSARALHHLIESMPESQEELELIHRRSQLVVAKSNVVRAIISDPSIIDLVQYSPREFSIIGLARGSTTLTLWFENERDPLIYLVRVIRDPALEYQRKVDYGKLEKKLQSIFPNSKVYLIPMSWKIIVRGQARDQEEAAHILEVVRGEAISQDGSLFGPQANNFADFDAGGAGGAANYWEQINGGNGNNLYSGFIINELKIPGEFQVALRVRVAELNRTMARGMGIDWSVLFNDGRHLLTTSMGGLPGNIGGVFENGEVTVALNWLASNGTAKILAEPRLTVLSGREARFLSGGEFAVPTVVGIGGAAGQTTSFRGFGTSLLATPTVLDRDNIRLTCIAEYSNINEANAVNGIPGTDARRIETTVELREGQTLAMAGLLSHRSEQTVRRIPYLGDIPKIGPILFGSKNASQDENELLILVSPEIVRPMDAHEVPPVPGFEATSPHDHEFYFQNATEGAPDTGYYQVPPYGSGSVGTNVGYQHFNPGPANSMYSPQPTNPNGTAYPPASQAPAYYPQQGQPVQSPSPQPMPQQGYPSQSAPSVIPQQQQPQNGRPMAATSNVLGPRMSNPPAGAMTQDHGILRTGHTVPAAGNQRYAPQALIPQNQGQPQARPAYRR